MRSPLFALRFNDVLARAVFVTPDKRARRRRSNASFDITKPRAGGDHESLALSLFLVINLKRANYVLYEATSYKYLNRGDYTTCQYPDKRNTSAIDGALHAVTTAIQHMGVNHRGFHIFMPQEFLDGANIIPGFQQVSCETVP